jgi:2-iminobutanoate/2-iminopropanoate deaminase
MSHKIIDIDVSNKIADYSDAVVVEGDPSWFYLSGTPGIGSDGELPESFAEQAENCWTNIKKALEKAGFELSDLVKVTTWVTDPSFIPENKDIRARALGGVRPAFMLGVIDAMVWPEIKIEVEVVAAKAS